MRTPIARCWLASIALPLLVFAAVPSGALLRCAMDGVARTHCCCPERAPSEAASVDAGGACCCSVEPGRSEPLPPSARRADACGSEPERLACAIVDLPAPRWAGHHAPPGVNAAEPALGPPLVLLKRSLLI